MCIFSQPVISVNNTQIFARATSRSTQFLAYQMNYESRDDNAMILPIPVRRPAHDGSLQFVDLRDYDRFFEDLARGFPYKPTTFNISCSPAFNVDSAGPLEVFEVGNYVASFVPKLVDFSRLNDRFRLPANVWAQIPKYAGYGFAVFQLAAGSLKPHPMAFEFEFGESSIYFPTMHIHDGQIHEDEEFDHVLYLQHAGFDSRVYGYQNSHVADKSTGLMRSKRIASHFCDMERSKGVIHPDLLVHRRIIRGIHPNRDTEIRTHGDPARPTLNLRPLLSYSPLFFVGAVVAWFIARRTRMMKVNKTSASERDTPRL